VDIYRKGNAAMRDFSFRSGSRRRFFHLLAGAAAAFGCSKHALAGGPQNPRTLKLGYILSRNSQLGAGAEVFAKEISKRTNERYRIDQYPDSALGGEVEMLKAVQLGTVDLAFITGAPLPNFVPEVGVFNIPFIFRDVSHAHAVLDGPIGEAYLAKFQSKDLIALAWGENGLRHLTNSRREIRAPKDLKGLKLRIPQSEVMLAGFRALGADAHELEFPLLYSALQSGQFDGQENPIATIISSKFYQVQKYLTLSGHVYDPAILFMAFDIFGDLSTDDRNSFVEAAKLAGEASRQFAAAAQKDGVAELAKSGMQVVANIDRARFAAAMAPANPIFAQQFGTNIIHQIRAYS
jgi:tripartite ATP-independent transporter DctP family solute receptor